MRKKFLSAFMLGALTLAATSTFVSCKDYDGDISALKSDVQALQNGLNDLKTKHDADIAALTTQLNNAKTELQAAIDKKADKTVVEALAAKVESLETRMAAAEARLNAIDTAIAELKESKADKSDVENKYVALTGMINTVDGKVIALTGDVEKIADDLKNLGITVDNLKAYTEENFRIQGEAIKAAEGRLDKLEAMLSDYPEVKAQVAKNKADIAALADRVDQAEKDIKANASAISELVKKVNELKSQIDAVEGRVDVLEVLVNKRPTSIVFAPTTYVNGVEAINFAALKYYDWNVGAGKDIDNNYLANGPILTKSNRIDDGTTEAVYYVNPSSVDESSFEGGLAGLSFLANDATNELFDPSGLLNIGRASESPIKVVAEKSKIENGKMTLKLKKNTTASFEYEPTITPTYVADNFITVSLRAPLSEKAKLENEKGQEIIVWSDWARLTETVTTPRIHNNQAEFVYDKVYAIEKEYSHYYNFGEVYTLYGKTNPEGQPYTGTEAVKFTGHTKAQVAALIKEPVAYDATLDLKPLVTVCDNEGNIINYPEFGLSFEFRMLDTFNVLDAGDTDTYTNQQKFATVTDGVLTPCAIDGTKKNRDAIDKTPVVQVILRDKANNAVVDVRYIVVVITEHEIDPQPIGIQVDGNDRFDCGNNYVVKVTSEEMNKMAAKLDLNSGVEFTTLYKFGDVLYAENGKDKIGDVQYLGHGGATEQASNLLVTFDAANFPLDDALYNGGSKTVKGLVKIYNLYGQYAYYLPVTVTVYFDKSRQNGYKPGYQKIANYWKAGQNGATWNYVVANPTLRSNMDDATTDYDISGFLDTQLIYNILNAYQKGTASPDNVEQMITNLDPHDGDMAWFAFDEDRLVEVIGNGYSVVDAANYQILKKGTENAAIIWKSTGKIQLWENGSIVANEIKGAGIHGVPSAAAKGFVAYDELPATEPATKNGIPVKIMAKQCNHLAVIDQYIVRFEKPLQFTDNKPAIDLNDQYDAGSGFTKDWTTWFTLKEAFGRQRNVLAKTDEGINLRKWYGVQKDENPNACSLHADKANWIHPHIVTGKLGDVENVCIDATFNGKKLSDWKDSYGKAKYVLTYTVTKNDAKYGSDATFTFYNNSGNAITEDMVITVPVTIETKWRTYKQNVTVTVHQITTTAK